MATASRSLRLLLLSCLQAEKIIFAVSFYSSEDILESLLEVFDKISGVFKSYG